MSTFPKIGLIGASPADLTWLEGSWLGRNGEDFVEEHWSGLGGGSLIGMFRWVAEGRVRFFELIAIEQEGEIVYMRIKHFDPKLVGWEEKAEALELMLARQGGQEAVFVEVGKPDPRWVVYRREGEDRLLSYFASRDGDVIEPGMFAYARR